MPTGQDGSLGRLGARNRSVERGKRRKNRREDLVWFPELHFGFGRVDIGIHPRRGKGEKENDDRKSPLRDDMAIRFKDGLVNGFILHKALIHIEVDPVAVSSRKGGKTRQPRKANLSILIFELLKLIIHFSSKDGFHADFQGSGLPMLMEQTAIMDEFEGN